MKARRSPRLACALLRPHPTFAAELPRSGAHRDPAGRLVRAGLGSEPAADRPARLGDRPGHRLAGSPRLEAAGGWCAVERADRLRQPVPPPLAALARPSFSRR